MLALDIPEDFPEDLIERLGQAKAEVMEHLRREGMARRYRQVFPGKYIRDAEIAEIDRQVHSYGVCLTWCEVVDDFVAFCRSEDDRGRVPQDFVAYSLSELVHLFVEDGGPVAADTLRRIHAAKRAGAVVTGSRLDNRLEAASGDSPA
jgi:hypothetical protein